MRTWHVWILAGCMMLALSQRAEAACTVTTSAVSFGTYDVFSSVPNDSIGTVTYRCGPPDRNITVMLGPGASSSFTPRTMVKGAETMSYNLYRDSSRSTIWGDGTGGTSFYSLVDPPNNQDVVLTIYARIPAGQDVSAGSYGDNISVVINF
jgi:spore coat protein U-like protein